MGARIIEALEEAIARSKGENIAVRVILVQNTGRRCVRGPALYGSEPVVERNSVFDRQRFKPGASANSRVLLVLAAKKSGEVWGRNAETPGTLGFPRRVSLPGLPFLGRFFCRFTHRLGSSLQIVSVEINGLLITKQI